MVTIQLSCTDGESSHLSGCRLVEASDGRVALEGEHGESRYSLHDLVISDRLGNSPRSIKFPDGRLCECESNGEIDALLGRHATDNSGWLLHRLESKFRYILAAVLLTAVITTLAVGYGIPALAKQVAFMVPVQEESFLGEELLSVLDETILEESTISTDERLAISHRFNDIVAGIDGYRFMLEFRDGGELGANALALPDGTVVLTDQLVRSSERLEELASIMAHEVGHIVNRHSLRHLIQNSTVGLLIMAVTGDLSAVSALAASLPTLLVDTHYSREFEREADRYAYQYLIANDISPVHFNNIIQRITEGESGGGFLSTHPSVDERILMFSQ